MVCRRRATFSVLLNSNTFASPCSLLARLYRTQSRSRGSCGSQWLFFLPLLFLYSSLFFQMGHHARTVQGETLFMLGDSFVPCRAYTVVMATSRQRRMECGGMRCAWRAYRAGSMRRPKPHGRMIHRGHACWGYQYYGLPRSQSC